MKIGIITHHYIKNYGAFWQAYALQEVLKEIFSSHDVCIINYKNDKHFLANTRPFLLENLMIAILKRIYVYTLPVLSSLFILQKV